jgi:putative transcriptional regulator
MINKPRKLSAPEQGSLLISEPFLLDTYFKRSVVLLTEHDQHGTVGLILNKPTDVHLNEAVEDFPEFRVPLYFGGPVETDTLFYVHKLGQRIPGAKQIANGLWWGGDYDEIKRLIQGGDLSSEEIRFYAGYSGWEPEQLVGEMKERSWLVFESSAEFAFAEDPALLWRTVLRNLGNEYAILANFPEDPNLN